MISFPNIKINIGLDIVAKRPDGYHNIESIFYPVPFCDVLEIVPSAQTTFSSSGIEIPGTPDSNLCLKAYQLIKKDFDIPSVHIRLHKVVPIGAGLGGGSSDAAFTLKMLNEMFELKQTDEQLEEYAKKLGSDCAFFIKNKPKYCFHKGDEFEDIELDLSMYNFVIVYPNIHISTPVAYAGVKPEPSKTNLKTLIKNPVVSWKSTIKNDFEKSIFNNFDEISSIKEKMYQSGAVYASMSGSGSSVFGIFDKNYELDNSLNEHMVWESGKN
jgi:4-diphosphocytidyl-2-C-methyl-D-erythritol kinase